MVLRVYQIFDSGVQAFHTPNFLHCDRDAVEAFRVLVNDPKSRVSKSPGDYTFFQVGTYDDETGRITYLQSFENLGVGSKFVQQRSVEV